MKKIKVSGDKSGLLYAVIFGIMMAGWIVWLLPIVQADGSVAAILTFFLVAGASVAMVAMLFFAWHIDYYFTDANVMIVRGLVYRKTYPVKELAYIYGVWDPTVQLHLPNAKSRYLVMSPCAISKEERMLVSNYRSKMKMVIIPLDTKRIRQLCELLNQYPKAIYAHAFKSIIP